MPKQNFSFDLYYKYWPPEFKDWAFLKQKCIDWMSSKGITVLDITFKDVPTDPVTNPAGAKLVVSVKGADSVDLDLEHNKVAARLGLNI